MNKSVCGGIPSLKRVSCMIYCSWWKFAGGKHNCSINHNQADLPGLMATFLHVGRFPKSRNTRGGRAPKRREKVRTAREELCENGQIAACLIIGSHSPSFCPTFCYFFCCASGQICRLWRGEIISSSARYRAFTKRIIPPCWLIRTQWFN